MTAITSGLLAAALNQRVVQEQFDVVRPTINGLIALAPFAEPQRPEAGDKLNWLDISVGADSDVTTAISLAADTTLDVTDGTLFRTGMILSTVSGEQILVESVATNALTVQRGFGGTTAADIASGDTLQVESVGREENSQAATDRIYQPVEVENLFQTVDTGIEFSRRALATLQLGNTNELAFQVNERATQLLIQMNRMLLRGRKATATVAGEPISFAGGIGYFLDQAGAISVDHAGAALTLDAINTISADLVKRGGKNTHLVMGVNKARELQALINANYQSARLADFVSDEGGLVRLPSDLPLVGGASEIVIDTNMADNEILFVNSMYMRIVPMAAGNAKDSGAWITKDATTPGQDGEKVRILGDFSFELRNTKSHFARLTNIA